MTDFKKKTKNFKLFFLKNIDKSFTLRYNSKSVL